GHRQLRGEGLRPTMSQAEKRLEAMRRNPAADWRIADVETVCGGLGIDCTPPAHGSHYTVSHASQRAILTIPARRPIKPVYIRALLHYIDAVQGATHSHGPA